MLASAALDDVWRQAKEMNNACVEMQAQLRATKTRTRDLIEQTNAIQGQTRDVAKRSEMIGRFVSKYQVGKLLTQYFVVNFLLLNLCLKGVFNCNLDEGLELTFVCTQEIYQAMLWPSLLFHTHTLYQIGKYRVAWFFLPSCSKLYSFLST